MEKMLGMSDFGTHTKGASSTRVVRSLQIDGSHNNPPDVSDSLTRRVDKPLSTRGLFAHQKKQSVIPARNKGSNAQGPVHADTGIL